MTICVGVISGEGIVIAADTEETAGDAKRDQSKLFHFLNGDGPPHPGTSIPPGILAILTGAGDPGYLDALFYSVSSQAIPCKNMPEFEEFFSKKVKSFHEDHIFPITEKGVVPTTVEVLAAITCGWHTSLFVTTGSTVRKAVFHTAIGLGSHFAQNLLNQWPWCKTLKEAQLLAAYVVYATKSQVATCGLHTSLSSLHECVMETDADGKAAFRQPLCPMEIGFDQEMLRKWEASFDTKWRTRQKNLLFELLAEELKDTV